MRPTFPLFTTPLDLAHKHWKSLLQKGDTVIDATLGNGKDALVLCSILADLGEGKIIGFDIQEKAVGASSLLLKEKIPHFIENVELFTRSHKTFPETIKPGTVKLIVYNLGYLPGGDKRLTTQSEETICSLENALPLLTAGGCLCVTCYPGHDEGKKEYAAVVSFMEGLDTQTYCVCAHQFLNRKDSPVMILVQKPRI